MDFRDIIGHEQAKKAFEIAAAGEQNVLMSGSGAALVDTMVKAFIPRDTLE